MFSSLFALISPLWILLFPPVSGDLHIRHMVPPILLEQGARYGLRVEKTWLFLGNGSDQNFSIVLDVLGSPLPPPALITYNNNTLTIATLFSTPPGRYIARFTAQSMLSNQSSRSYTEVLIRPFFREKEEDKADKRWRSGYYPAYLGGALGLIFGVQGLYFAHIWLEKKKIALKKYYGHQKKGVPQERQHLQKEQGNEKIIPFFFIDAAPPKNIKSLTKDLGYVEKSLESHLEREKKALPFYIPKKLAGGTFLFFCHLTHLYQLFQGTGLDIFPNKERQNLIFYQKIYKTYIRALNQKDNPKKPFKKEEIEQLEELLHQNQDSEMASIVIESLGLSQQERAIGLLKNFYQRIKKKEKYNGKLVPLFALRALGHLAKKHKKAHAYLVGLDMQYGSKKNTIAISNREKELIKALIRERSPQKLKQPLFLNSNQRESNALALQTYHV